MAKKKRKTQGEAATTSKKAVDKRLAAKTHQGEPSKCYATIASRIAYRSGGDNTALFKGLEDVKFLVAWDANAKSVMVTSKKIVDPLREDTGDDWLITLNRTKWDMLELGDHEIVIDTALLACEIVTDNEGQSVHDDKDRLVLRHRKPDAYAYRENLLWHGKQGRRWMEIQGISAAEVAGEVEKANQPLFPDPDKEEEGAEE